jgi:cyclopropane-fatty-acyl-phospholipid synthase
MRTQKSLRSKDYPQKELRLVERIKNLENVTFETDTANKQHYEVPTDFFLSHLGQNLKYSSCEWTESTKTLKEAEEHTIQIYQNNLQLDKLEVGSNILEVGNGWGSLCLANAKKYPHLQFDSFSNSKTQIDHIKNQISKYAITNLNVWQQDIDDFVKETNISNKKYSRIVSIECIEHCRAYDKLFEKLSSVLLDDGFCFFQILGHSEYSYLMNDNSWMGRNFFTGGTIPSMHLFHHFNEHLLVEKLNVISGKQYAKTLDSWLHRMYDKKTEIMKTFVERYGKDANKHYEGWRMFYLMCSESFGFNDGKDWCVGYFKMKKR